jgi:hypothetical protein
MRQSVSVGPIGYLASALLVVVLVLGIVLIMALVPVGTYLLQHANVSDAWGQLSDGGKELAKKLAIAFALISVLTLTAFSIFVGISTHNATGLGADQPLLAPYWAATCWTGLIWAQVRIAVGLLVPAGLLWEGYTIPGLIAGIVALEIANRHLDDAGGWLERPARHLADLYVKLGLDSSVASPASSVWSQCFRIANWLVICVAAIPAVGYGIYSASNLAGRSEVFGWSSSGYGASQLAIAVIVGALVAFTVASIALLVPLSFGLVQRQRTRKTLVRVGRARSWVARPGQGEYSHAGQSSPAGPAPTHYGGFEDDDRIVERRPAPVQDPSAPGFGGPQAPTGPVYEDPRIAAGSGPSDPGFGGGSGFGGSGFGGSGPAGPGQRGPGPSFPGQDPSFPGQGPGFHGPGPSGPGDERIG